MEAFLRKQAEKEGGAGAVAVGSTGKALQDDEAAPASAPTPVSGGLPVSGADAVTDADAKRMCREVVASLARLREGRDMTVNEVKLTLAIESPIVRDQASYLGVEAGGTGGVARDAIAAALGEVAAGRIPRDRLALRELHREMLEWPFLDGDGGSGSGSAAPAAPAAKAPSPSSSSPYAAAVDKAPASGWRAGQARPPPMGRDAGEEPQSLADRLPDWMGYGFLYLVSSIPVLIAGSVVAILFFNSLR
jgi:hypothetical protein